LAFRARPDGGHLMKPAVQQVGVRTDFFEIAIAAAALTDGE
jgi:hypothetical protein